MKVLSALMVTLALAVAPAAFAQEKAATDPVKLDLAKQLVAASGGAKNADLMIKQIYGSLDTVFAKQFTGEQQRLYSAIQHDMQAELLNMIPTIMDQTVDIYARTLTEKELRDAVTWQTSESGQAIAAKMPALTQEIVKAEIPYMQAMLPRLMQKVGDRACEEAKCTEAERQQVAAVLAKMGRPS